MQFGNTEMIILGAAFLIFLVYIGKARGRWNAIDWSGLLGHLFWLSIWYGFYLVWGKFKWRTAEYGSPEWMFDNYGHALGGFIGGFQGMYELWYFFPFLYYDRGRVLWWFAIFIVIPAIVICGALGFEVGEMIYDFQQYAIQAQKGGADTTIDITLAFVFAYPGIVAWYIYHKLKECVRRRWSPKVNLDKICELKTRAKILREKEEEIKDERRELRREWRLLLREQVKAIPPNIMESLKETFGFIREEEDKIDF